MNTAVTAGISFILESLNSLTGLSIKDVLTKITKNGGVNMIEGLATHPQWQELVDTTYSMDLRDA